MRRGAAARVRNAITISVRREDPQTVRARKVAARLGRRVFAIHARPALAADAAHLVAVREREEPVPLADDVLKALDARREELDDAAATGADQVVVVLLRPE